MNNSLNGAFSMHYDVISQCKSLSFPAKAIIAKALSFSRINSALYASQQTIADQLGTSRDTVKRTINKELKRLPFMVIKEQGLKVPLRISVNEPALVDWLAKEGAANDDKHGADCSKHGADCTINMVQIAPQLDTGSNTLKELTTKQFSQAQTDCDDSINDSKDDKVKGVLAVKRDKTLKPMADELSNDEFPLSIKAVAIMKEIKLANPSIAKRIHTDRLRLSEWMRCEENLQEMVNPLDVDDSLNEIVLSMLSAHKGKDIISLCLVAKIAVEHKFIGDVYNSIYSEAV